MSKSLNDLNKASLESQSAAAVSAGNAYTASSGFNLADSAVQKLGITTSSDIGVATTIAIVAQSPDFTISLHEANTYSSGTAVVPANLNRNSINVLDTTMTDGVTATLNTAVFSTQVLGTAGQGNQSAVGGTFQNPASVLLKPNTDYVLAVTNDGGAAYNFTATIVFIEA